MLKNELLKVKLLVDVKVIEETLTRMGIPDNKNHKLYQSCHLFEAFGDYFIVHFKQLFIYTTKNGAPGFGNVSQEDLHRRDSIAYCLKKWGMIDFDESLIENHDIKIFVLPYKEKHQWELIKKINMNNVNM